MRGGGKLRASPVILMLSPLAGWMVTSQEIDHGWPHAFGIAQGGRVRESFEFHVFGAWDDPSDLACPGCECVRVQLETHHQAWSPHARQRAEAVPVSGDEGAGPQPLGRVGPSRPLALNQPHAGDEVVVGQGVRWKTK